MKADEEGGTCQAFDMLVPGIGELIGGSVREDDLTKLENIMKSKNMNLAD